MKIQFKAHHLKLYKQIAQLFIRYGRSDIVQEFGLEDALEDDDLRANQKNGPNPEQLAADLEKMGPTFVKLGQLLSSRSDLLPERYLVALSRLQDNVQPFGYEEVERTIQSELGARISKAFSRFDPEPLASASLGQVHLAALRDGRPVVVKVQRPNIRRQIAEDMEVLDEIATFMERHTEVGRQNQFHRIFEEFRKTLLNELDYTREAHNLETLAENLKEFNLLRVPKPVPDYTTRSVLTMDYIEGQKITALGPLIRLELDGEALAEELFRAYLKQVLVDGIFHADPHPGNIFLTEDKKIALLDLGMIGRTSPAMQETLIKLLLAISEGNGDEAADLAIRMSETTDQFKETDFRRKIAELVSEQAEAVLEKIDIGKTILQVTRIAGQSGLFVPSELTMLGKTLLQLDQIGKALNPCFNPNEAIRRNVTELLNRRVWKNLSAGKLFGSVLEVKEFIGTLPIRLNKILDAVANAELEVKIRAIDTHPFLESFQKIANRITTGLILAAMIIGASLLMHVQTTFEIFGYPGLAILFFLFAAGGGVWLVINIFIHDHRNRKNKS